MSVGDDCFLSRVDEDCSWDYAGYEGIGDYSFYVVWI